MALIDTLLGSGIFVMFLAVVVGMGFGRINFGRGIKFGVAGPLLAGLILGHFGFTVPDGTRDSLSRCSLPQSA